MSPFDDVIMIVSILNQEANFYVPEWHAKITDQKFFLVKTGSLPNGRLLSPIHIALHVIVPILNQVSRAE